MGETDINDCWSLLAVVKECTRKSRLRAQLTAENTIATTTTTTTTTTPKLGLETSQSYSQKPFLDQFVPKNNLVGFMLPSATADGSALEDELRDLYKPFLVTYNHPPVISTIKAEPAVEASGMSSNLDLLVEQNSQQRLHLRDFQNNPKQSSSAVGGSNYCIYKKKKFEDRRVVKFTLEELSRNDKWAWRKYGQKPIKGSPYPRNYYRCSSMKGCKARKQVERSPIDPLIYIVTYTDHHHHPCPPIRNSSGPRVKITVSDPVPPPEIESPTSTVPVPIIRQGYGYGYGSGGNGVKIEDEEHHGERSFGSGEMDEDHHDILISNSMADSDLLTGMEQLSGGGMSTSSSTNCYYNENVGYDELIRLHNKGCDPNVKMEVQLKENGSGYGLGFREMYASAPTTLAGAHEPPSNMGQNIWSNGVIRPQAFFF